MFTIGGNLKSECYDEYTQRIKNIAAKLVIGHALYDLSEFFPHHMNKDYDSQKALIGQQLSLDGKHISIYNDFTIIESDVQFALVSQLTEEQRKEFNLPIASNLFPEIGSRGFVDTILHPGSSDVSYAWTMLQSDNYRYLSAPGIVRIVIRETLYI